MLLARQEFLDVKTDQKRLQSTQVVWAGFQGGDGRSWLYTEHHLLACGWHVTAGWWLRAARLPCGRKQGTLMWSFAAGGAALQESAAPTQLSSWSAVSTEWGTAPKTAVSVWITENSLCSFSQMQTLELLDSQRKSEKCRKFLNEWCYGYCVLQI